MAGIINQIDGNSAIQNTYTTIYNNDYSINQAILTLEEIASLIESTYEDHVADLADNHNVSGIINDSTVSDGNTGRLKGVVENLQAQITALVLGGTETDPRLTQALIDFENTDWASLGFKALQDFWQERIVELEKYYTDASVPPETITNQSPTATFDVNNGGVTPVISGSGSTITNVAVNGVGYGNYLGDIGAGVETGSFGVKMTADNTNFIDARLPVTLKTSTLYTFVFDIIKNTVSTAGSSLIRPDGFIVSGVPLPTGVIGIYTITKTTLSSITSPELWTFLSNTTASGEEFDFKLLAIIEGDATNLNVTHEIKGTQNLTDLKFDIRGENLFDPNTVRYGGYYDKNTGVWVSNSTYASTGFIPVSNIQNAYQSPTICFASIVAYWDLNYNYISGETSSAALTIPSNAVWVTCTLDLQDMKSNGYTVDDVTITEGITPPTSYIEPFHNELYAPVTLTSKDNYTIEGGKVVVDRNVRVIESLDGRYDWEVVEKTGFKWLRAKVDLDILGGSGNSICTKYDGKNLPFDASPDSEDTHLCYTESQLPGNVLIAVSDNDSGWGDSYTPTSDEIKAYMNGWIATVSGTSEKFEPSTAESDKRWVKRYQGIGAKSTLPFGADYESGSIVFDCPKEKAYGDITETYKLQYDLAEPVQETVDLFGDMTMPEGKVYVTMESGVRFEKAAPVVSSNIVYINDISATGSELNKKADEILKFIYDDGFTRYDVTNKLTIQESSSGYGKVRAFDNNGLLTEGEISNLYVEYKTLSSENNTNVFDAQVTYKDDLINVMEVMGEKIAYQAERLDIMRTQKASKDQEGWIEPTLLNGWVNFSENTQPASYYKDDFGNVHLRFQIKDGVVDSGTAILILPSGYRPEYQISFDVFKSTSFGKMTVEPNGEVQTRDVDSSVTTVSGELIFRGV